MTPFPRAILFDMDGTLTAPMLDFPRIKREMGIGDRPILEALAEMNAEQRRAAEAVLHRHEEHAAENSTLNPGCEELLAWLAERSIATALITRNSRASTQTVIARHRLKIDVLITREDAPHKPNPAPLRLACEKLGVSCDHAWMVGDGQYDIEAGLAAGMKTIWISHGYERDYGVQGYLMVTSLLEFLVLLKSARQKI